MKPFEQQNHYEILDLSLDATPLEIRQAYRDSVKLYDESMATYSLFSEEERQRILCRIEEAFMTLISEQIRPQYDQIMARLGQAEEDSLHSGDTPKKPIALVDFRFSRETKGGRPKPKLSRPATTPLVNDVLAHEVLTGHHLKTIRTELGISLDEIAHQTKIRLFLLDSIEADRFDNLPSRLHLRSFLKAYVQCLHLHVDPQEVVDKYMKRIGH